MKLAIATLCIGCLLMTVSAAGSDVTNTGSLVYEKIKGRFAIEFAEDVTLDGVTSGFGMFRVGVPSVERLFDEFKTTMVRPLSAYDVGKSTPLSRIYIVEIADDVDDDAFRAAMTANPNIVRIENDLRLPFHASPNDPSYGSQWHHNQGTDIDIDSPDAWNLQTGSEAAVIAIIDSGVEYDHPDLIGNIWVNPGEDLDGDGIVFDSSDINFSDDDGNGKIDDLIGWDFVTSTGSDCADGEDCSFADNDPDDFSGHGTHVAGIAAAMTNNGTGGAGIAGGWGEYRGDGGARIMCLRVGYEADDGQGYVILTHVVEAIIYAAYNGADVINYSAGSSNYTGMNAALGLAMDSGIVFCNSAGNSNSMVADYFGTYDGIITVAATNAFDQKWTWGSSTGSNYGSWVEVSAPGEAIYSTYTSPPYATLTGTSMAAPMVAGLAALIKSHHPEWDKSVIDTLIINNTDNIDGANPGYAGLLGSGRINAYKCLEKLAVADFTVDERIGTAPHTVTFTDLSPIATSWSWDFGDTETSFDQNPQHTYTDPGLYTVSLEVDDPNGTHTRTKKYYIFASADTVSGDSNATIPGNGDDSAAVEIFIKNTIPLDTFMLSFVYTADSGTADLDYRGFSVEGTRSEVFDTVILRAQAPTTDKVSLEFFPYRTTVSEPLPPGDGSVVKLWFTATGSGTVVFDTVTLVGYKYSVTNQYVDYLPEFVPFRVWVAQRGDANDDGTLSVADAVFLVEYVFKGGPSPVTMYQGDVDASGQINVADPVYMINYIFKGGPPPPP